jgi:ribosomal protein S18 acetylase RimI-like enzyme
MEIRKAEAKDAKGIANVLMLNYNIGDIDEGTKVFESETAKFHRYIVALENEEVIGIVTLIIHGLPKHGLCELDRIAVLEEFRGKGAAKQLFDALVENAKMFYEKHNSKLRKLYLLTHDSNERAQKFYHKLGFKHETTLKQHYYSDKEEFVFSMFFD